MKKITITSAMLFIVFTLPAQHMSVKYSPPIAVPRTTTVLKAGKIGESIYVVQARDIKRRQLNLQVFDAENLQLRTQRMFKESSCKGKSDCIDKDFGYEGTRFFRENYIVFYSSFEKNSEQYMLFAQKMQDDGTFDGKLVVLDKIQAKKRSNAGSYEIVVSNDSTRFLVLGNPPYDKYAGEEFNFKIYNSALENLHNLSITLPYKDKDMSLLSYYLGNDDRIFLLTQVEIKKSQRAAGKSPYIYSVFMIDPKDQSVSEYKLEIPKMNIEDVEMKLDDERDRLICAGFYSDVSGSYKGGDIDGFFYMTVDPVSQKVISLGVKALERKLISELMNRKKVREGKGISKNFHIRNIIDRKDGRFTILAENAWDEVVTTTTSTGRTTTTTTTYHYYRNSIFVIDIDRDGTILSLIPVPKAQHTVNDNGIFSSYIPFQSGDRLILLYNDHPENTNSSARTLKQVKSMPSIGKCALMAVEINKDGTYTRKKLADVKESKMAVLADYGFQIADGEFVAPAMVPGGAASCGCLAIFSKLKMSIAKFKLE